VLPPTEAVIPEATVVDPGVDSITTLLALMTAATIPVPITVAAESACNLLTWEPLRNTTLTGLAGLLIITSLTIQLSKVTLFTPPPLTVVVPVTVTFLKYTLPSPTV
jgi:hypothetical protein